MTEWIETDDPERLAAAVQAKVRVERQSTAGGWFVSLSKDADEFANGIESGFSYRIPARVVWPPETLAVPEGMTPELLREIRRGLNWSAYDAHGGILDRWADDLAAQAEGGSADDGPPAESPTPEPVVTDEEAEYLRLPLTERLRQPFSAPAPESDGEGEGAWVVERWRYYDELRAERDALAAKVERLHELRKELHGLIYRPYKFASALDDGPLVDALRAKLAALPEVPDGCELLVVPREATDRAAEGKLVQITTFARAAVARRPKPEPRTERVPWYRAMGRRLVSGDLLGQIVQAYPSESAPAGIYVEYELPELATTGNPEREWESGRVEVLVEDGES